MNSFERFGVKHLSASSLNCWRAAPALWAVRYLLSVKDESGPEAMRGTAVEAGLEAILRGWTYERALEVTYANFEANAQGDASDKFIAERAGLGDYLKVAAEAVAGKNAELLAYQLKVEHWLDGVPVPLVGYIDFVFDDGSLFDLKTTKRIPSIPTPSHARQVSIYMAARETTSGSLLYVSDKRAAPYLVEKPAVHLADLRRDALSLMRFLDRSESPAAAVLSLPCDLDGYLWGEASKAKVLQLLT